MGKNEKLKMEHMITHLIIISNYSQLRIDTLPIPKRKYGGLYTADLRLYYGKWNFPLPRRKPLQKGTATPETITEHKIVQCVSKNSSKNYLL